MAGQTSMNMDSSLSMRASDNRDTDSDDSDDEESLPEVKDKVSRLLSASAHCLPAAAPSATDPG